MENFGKEMYIRSPKIFNFSNFFFFLSILHFHLISISVKTFFKFKFNKNLNFFKNGTIPNF